MPLPNVRTHTDAVITALEDFDLTVGDARAPDGHAPPYVVVYPIPGGRTSGTLDEPDADAELIYQVTCIGSTREQAQWLVDKVLGLLDTFDVADRYIPRVALEEHAGIQRDDQQTPPVFMAAPKFRVFTTPA